MSGTVLVRGAKQLLTLRGPGEARRGSSLTELGIIRDGALLIEDGRILEVGPSRRIENLARSHRSQEIDAAGRVVMPGFVDCHAHLMWSGLENASAHRLESRAQQVLSGMARHGTTSLEASSGYDGDQRGELKLLRVQAKLNRTPLDIASTYWNPADVPAAHATDPEAYRSWICSVMLPAIRHKSLARFAGFRCGGSVYNAEQGSRYLESARSLGFELKIHDGGSASGDAVRLAVETGAASVELAAGAGPAEAELLSQSGAIAILLPGAALQRGGDTSGRKLIDGGAAVALASNFNPGAGPTYSMQAIMAMACVHMGLSAAEAICAATFNAAWAIGLAEITGSLEAGKQADFIVLNAPDYREFSHHIGVNLVNRTVKRGVTIYQEGKVALR